MTQTSERVSPDWIRELAEIAAMTLADFRRNAGEECFSMLSVECRPADGWISLSMLLTAEAAVDPLLAGANRTGSWLHEGLERKYGMWRLAAGVERVMQETYHCAPQSDGPAIAKAFVRACTEAFTSQRVWREVDLFRRADGFHIRVGSGIAQSEPFSA